LLFSQRYERAYNYLQEIVSGLGEKEAHDALNNAVCKEKNHEEVSIGLLMGILTDPNNAPKYYRDLTLVSRDGLASIMG
jgi:integrator complex subunit 3